MVIPLMQGYIQLPQESVRAYANHLKAKWRQAGWNLQKHEEVLYDIAWAGLHNSLKNKVGPMTPACGKFDTLNEFFDKAVASEVTHVKNKTPQHHQPTPPAANPASRDQPDTPNQAAEDNCQAYCQHHRSQRKFSKANVLPANANNADLRTIR
jgi:hypothetical protein